MARLNIFDLAKTVGIPDTTELRSADASSSSPADWVTISFTNVGMLGTCCQINSAGGGVDFDFITREINDI
jgi:hypothetical protein